MPRTAIPEPTFTVVLTNHDSGLPGAVRHDPRGCPMWADRHAKWNHPGQRPATTQELTAMRPCALCQTSAESRSQRGRR